MRLKLLSTILFTLVLITGASFQTYAQQTEKPKEKECPLNFWDFTYPPMSFLGLTDAPAKIVSTVSGARTGVMLAGVDLKNLSGKTITAAKFQWFLFGVDSREKIVAQGETATIDVDECQPEEKCEIDYSIVWCKDIYKALVEDTSSKGELVIETAVSELSYKDGSNWKRK